MEWLKKLSAAIDYIEDNLDGDISYGEAARIACCSTFYFQRIFTVASDEPAPSHMFELEISSATWAVFENDGYFKEKVQSVFKRFYTEWLPFSGYEYAGLPDIEVYPVCKETPISGHSQVWIAIKKDKKEETCII